jgi:redox-sensitive bicupin YhaK (pirin superfamily)
MLDSVIASHKRSLGGFDVGRVLPSAQRRMIGPFIFFDHMGPMEMAKGIPRDVDVRPHPHIGLATVTYLFAGEIMHRDSVGSEQAILPGEVNWMTAGSGITHSERFERERREGGLVHGIQSWVALPDGQEEIAPSFSHHSAGDLPFADEKGAKLRVIAGEAFGLAAKVKTFSPVFYVHGEIAAGASAPLPDGYSQRAVYVASGEVEADGQSFKEGKMLIFQPKQSAVLKAVASSTVMMLGGEPVGPRYIEWNFVSSSKERIAQASNDWRAGHMKLPDLDNGEFIPLAPDRPPPLAVS